jgi:hypothetical protein
LGTLLIFAAAGKDTSEVTGHNIGTDWIIKKTMFSVLQNKSDRFLNIPSKDD